MKFRVVAGLFGACSVRHFSESCLQAWHGSVDASSVADFIEDAEDALLDEPDRFIEPDVKELREPHLYS